MALCESQLDSNLASMKEDERDSESRVEGSSDGESPDKGIPSTSNGGLYGLEPGALPLSVDYRSPISHFIPPAVEMYAQQVHKSEPITTGPVSTPGSPVVKRKRGRPRIDKTSPEYIAKSAARKQARDMAAAISSTSNPTTGSAEKRKRGRPRVDKTSPEYLARKRQRELEALEKKARKLNRRRDSGASSSGESTPRVKRKYTKRPPGTGPGPGRPRKDPASQPEKVKGKRGRPRKDANVQHSMQPQIRVRSNLMPINSEPITLDSDDEPDLGSPSHASDSLSLDENLRALRHIHEKYANINRDELYAVDRLPATSDLMSISSEDRSVNELGTRVEKLEDSSNSDSDSSSSGSSSTSSTTSSSSDSSTSSSSSDSETEDNNISRQTIESQNKSNQEEDDDDSLAEESLEDGGASPVSISASDNESPDKSYQCHVCKRWYSTLVTLKIHRRSHLPRSRVSSGALSRGGGRHACPSCPARFPRGAELARHRRAAHADRSPPPPHSLPTPKHACAACGKRFTHAHSLARHALNHARNVYRCVVCKASFAHSEQLAAHLNTHLDDYKRLKP